MGVKETLEIRLKRFFDKHTNEFGVAVGSQSLDFLHLQVLLSQSLGTFSLHVFNRN